MEEEDRSVIVNLKRFSKTPLERELDGYFRSSKPRTVFADVESTYLEAMCELGTCNIKVRTNLVSAQIYKVGAEEIEIIN